MRTESFDLATLERRLRSGQFKIPQFQRDFKWRPAQVRLLVDSIGRNYPIGSLLVLPESQEVHLQSRTVDAVINDSDVVPGENSDAGVEIQYVLDGQQRLTSIARVFLNADPKRTFYFDLKKMLSEYDQEKITWISSRQKSKNDPERKENNKLIRTDIVLDQEKTDIFVSEYIEDSIDIPELRDSRSEQRKAAAKIKGIFEKIRKYRVPIVILDQETGVESVCRVFETINSTGTRLTTFDLAVAKFYPNPDLRSLFEESIDRYPILGKGKFDIDGEKVLQVLWLVYAKKNGSNLEPTKGNLLSLKPDFMIENWDNAAKELAYAYTWVHDRCGVRSNPEAIPNQNTLIDIAALHILFPDLRKNSSSSIDIILKKWFFCSSLQQGAKAQNYFIGENARMLFDYAEEKNVIKNPIVNLNIDNLLSLSAIDSRYKAIQCVISLSCKDDLIYMQSLDSDIQDHHIFPRSLLKKNGVARELVESVANKLFVLTKTNSEINDTSPYDYFLNMKNDALKKGIIHEYDRHLRSCLIPGSILDDSFIDQFKTENYQFYLKNRASLILEQIRQVIGDSLVDNLSLVIENEDDDEEDQV